MARPRRSRRTLTTVVVLVLLSVTIITLDETDRTHDITSGLKSVATDVFSPLRNAVDDILQPIGNFFSGAVHYGSVEEENAKLRATLGQLRQQIDEQHFTADQLRRIAALDHLSFVGGLPTVMAQTIAVNPSNFASTITIDKGRSQGVDVGMPVVGNGGLVGQVSEAAHNSATVRLITDGLSKVGVVFGNDLTAEVDGQGATMPMTADFVAPGTPVRTGELLATNGLQQAEFPPGIPVARIASHHTTTGATQIDITVRPTADLDDLDYVLVLQWSPSP